MGRIRRYLSRLGVAGAVLIAVLGSTGYVSAEDYGANPGCFSAAHLQPDEQPGGRGYGQRMQAYLDDCRTEKVQPHDEAP